MAGPAAAAHRGGAARLCAHYFSHMAWLEDGQLLRDAHRLAGIPGVLIHGRFDIGGPPDVPWLLHQKWPGSELQLVRTGHHGGDEMTEHMMTALNRFAAVASRRTASSRGGTAAGSISGMPDTRT
ncbi:MAG: hypothetical protein JO132_20535 [Streptosporangiaceae bacterium]|nr:hypothetical protein [Streptosporangiaceae bacterium]